MTARRGRLPRLLLPILAALAVLAFAASASAQAAGRGEDVGSGCVEAADGTLECGTIEIHGTLRNIVMVTFSRQGLGIRLLELRQSFVSEIEESVEEEPF